MVMTPSTMLPLGTSAPDFELVNVDGGMVSLANFQGKPGLAVMFICNHCPFVKHLADDLARFGHEYQQRGLGVVAISSNNVATHPADSPEQMVAEAEERGYSFPYLYDETQEVAIAYRAACTPDFYLFDSEMKLVYRGQYDSSRPDGGIPVTGKIFAPLVTRCWLAIPFPPSRLPASAATSSGLQGKNPIISVDHSATADSRVRLIHKVRPHIVFFALYGVCQNLLSFVASSDRFLAGDLYQGWGFVMSLPRLTCMFGLALALPMWGSLQAKNFRIETKIYVGEPDEDEQVQPIAETVTLFAGDIVYDFLSQPKRIAVYRGGVGERPGRFILLDPQAELQTELTTDRISGLLEKLRLWAAQQPEPELQFAANPVFDESFETETGKLVLASHFQTYEVTTEATEHVDAVAQYRDFVDWYARLNSLMHGGPPPEPRLEVNRALAERTALPTHVRLLRQGEKEPLRAEHRFTWLLSRRDRIRIDEVRDAMATYRRVSNKEFRDLASPPPADEE